MDAAVKGNNRPFAEQFADYKAGKMRPTDLFYLNNTSEYLQAAGLANEPIVMAQSVVTKAQRKATVDTHGHELSDDVILKLPEMIEKPVLLLKSDTVPNSSVVVTSVSDSSGNPVVVALHLSRNNGFDVVTRIASLYGKENSRNFIADQLIRGNLIGYSKKEANRLLHRDGLQLPRRNTAVDFDIISVAQDTDAVNNYSMQNSAEDANGKHLLSKAKCLLTNSLLKSRLPPRSLLLASICGATNRRTPAAVSLVGWRTICSLPVTTLRKAAILLMLH